MSRSKWGNVRTVAGGITFASAKEARRFGELTLLQRAGDIRDLKVQPRYPLIVNGEKVCTYVGDFEYVEKDTLVTEDVKGFQTPEFKLKAKLFHALYGRQVMLT